MIKAATIDQTRPDQYYARNSSLELLRIFAMLGIVSLHFASATSGSGVRFPIDYMSINKVWHRFIWAWGLLGNDIFFALSGYFLITSSRIRLKKLLVMWLKMFFYSVVFFLIFKFPDFTYEELFAAARPIKNAWWFARIYFFLYLIHTILNMFLTRLSKENYRKLLIAGFIVWSIIPMVMHIKSRMIYIFLYIAGGYIRLWADDYGSRKHIVYGFIFAATNFIYAVAIDFLSIKFEFLGKYPFYLYNMSMPFTILAALCFLIGFKHLGIRYNKVINILASATFGVYLIHQNKFVNSLLWARMFHAAEFMYSPYFIPYSLGVVPLVYISCTLIELARSKIFRLLSHGWLS